VVGALIEVECLVTMPVYGYPVHVKMRLSGEYDGRRRSDYSAGYLRFPGSYGSYGTKLSKN
jgi:hypothetical protein